MPLRPPAAGIRIALLALSLLAVTGCGSKSRTVTTTSTSAPATTIPTRARTIAAGDAILCSANGRFKRVQEQGRRLGEQVIGEEEYGRQKEVGGRQAAGDEQEAAILRGAATAINRLAAAPADAPILARIGVALNEAATIQVRDARLMETAGEASMSSIKDARQQLYRETREAGARAQALEEGYGFKAC
jgi:hypothetical protein